MEVAPPSGKGLTGRKTLLVGMAVCGCRPGGGDRKGGRIGGGGFGRVAVGEFINIFY